MTRLNNQKDENSEVWLEESEYAALISAINNRYKLHYEGETHGIIQFREHAYLFRVLDFNEYEIIRKWRIK